MSEAGPGRETNLGAGLGLAASGAGRVLVTPSAKAWAYPQRRQGRGAERRLLPPGAVGG
jgi:hypothetical protein